jgi:hypothetical protein
MTTSGPSRVATSADRQLRLVAEMTDARVMGPRVAAALGAAGRAPCHVLDAKYEPGGRCTALYRVGDQLVRGDLVDKVPAAVPGRPVVDPGVRLSCFPDDPDLPGLPATADPVRLPEALRDVLPGGGPVLRCRVDLVRYRPGRRATLAVWLRGPAGRPGQRLIAKSYHDDRKAAAVAAEAVLLDATADPGAPLRFAAVRAHVPALSLVVQERVAGVPLDDVVVLGGAPAALALRRAAGALAALHAQPVVSRRRRAVDAELARFLARARRVAAVDPDTGAPLVDLASRLATTVRDMPTDVVGLVHGDCKPSQFLLRGEDVVLLDLDSCGQADPAGDVGTFVTTLHQHALRQVLARGSTTSVARAGEALAAVFLNAYVTAAGGAPDAELLRRITWYEAVAAERKALRSFARSPRSPLTRALVVHGHGCLDRLRRTR